MRGRAEPFLGGWAFKQGLLYRVTDLSKVIVNRGVVWEITTCYPYSKTVQYIFYWSYNKSFPHS